MDPIPACIRTGHIILCTSRPAGTKNYDKAGFHILQAQLLSEAQQQAMLEERLGRDNAQALLKYIDDKMPIDSETHARVTAIPLMLSMMANFYEVGVVCSP